MFVYMYVGMSFLSKAQKSKYPLRKIQVFDMHILATLTGYESPPSLNM